MNKRIIVGATTLAAITSAVVFSITRTFDDGSFPSVSHVRPDDSRNPASAKKGPRKSSVLYKIKDDASADQLRDLQSTMRNFEIQVSKKLSDGKTTLAKAVKHANQNETEIAEALIKTGAVEFAEPDSLVFPDLISNDPYAAQQWHHPKIGTSRAWDVTLGSPTVTAASCDTGVDESHPDLANALLPGYNSESMAAINLAPVNSHGTQTAGAMAAVANNSLGVAGVAGAVKILPIKISNSADGAAYFSAITECITYAANNGAKVVNLSYGGTESAAVDTAAKYLRSRGGFLVVSAGNDGSNTSANVDYQSLYVVGATDQTDSLTSWSNRGTPTDIVAPGLDILTTDLGSSYVYASGTSLSAPLVSGAAALLYSVNSSFTPIQVEDILNSTAQKTLPGYALSTHGAGRLNVAAAVARAKTLVPTKRKK